ncbi:bactofilin family protein [Variovorax ginsengisoli]|uniref:Polymer-forming cytoskeletal protein n=1 Tax=Variovorax ginsengisoli TaxID=363844 RepID=A0ABT8SBJ2_9BURK|nr:polymer-forming cytoskeletal protein [Variovorax ginsengisoli]MDN8616484.1 polymer-forming cytoskeletal protein [Variovorax ginsengisoli]MDO1535654.1 polymer-forming cytoskeletal protein [Variovorax ginsengisoli]
MNSISNVSSAASERAEIPAFLAKNGSAPTVIGTESNFIGDLSISEGQDLHIEGCVVGNVFHGGKVVVAESGIVLGSIFASHLEVHGVVDAPDGEILAANLVVHGTSRITASEVTVAAGCMNYERGGFMSAQMGMLATGEVTERIEALLGKELDRAKERRAAIEHARSAARSFNAPVRAIAPHAGYAAAAALVPAINDESAPAAAQPEVAFAVAPAAEAPASAPVAPAAAPRVPFALVPPVADSASDEADDSHGSGDSIRAYAG